MAQKTKSKKLLLDKEEKANILESFQRSPHTNMREVKIEKLLPNAFDGVIVQVIDGKQCLFFQENFNKQRLKKWKNSPGFVFGKDVKKYYLGKPAGQYFLHTRDKELDILRLISDEEIQEFSSLGLIDVRVHDNLYMKLRTVKEGENLTSSKRYINQHENLNTEKEEPEKEEQEEVGTNDKNKFLF